VPRERSPDRDKAKQMWLASGGSLKLKDIAAGLNIGETQVRKWKSQDKWEASLKGNVTNQTKGNVTKHGGAPLGNKNAVGNKGGAPKGSQNAKGNRGGAGGPPGNKKAVTTGEHEAIWFDTLDEDELSLIRSIEMDPQKQVDESIMLLSVRERRMMKKIQNLKNGLTEKQRRVLQERISTKDVIQVHDEKTGQTKTLPVTRNELVTTQIEETEFRAIDDILKLEDALTRVQKEKLRAIELKHKLMVDDDPDDQEGDGLDSLTRAIEESKKLLAGES
jgi:uncharacterized protein YjcR